MLMLLVLVLVLLMSGIGIKVICLMNRCKGSCGEEGVIAHVDIHIEILDVRIGPPHWGLWRGEVHLRLLRMLLLLLLLRLLLGIDRKGRRTPGWGTSATNSGARCSRR